MLQVGTLIDGRYRILREIGRGGTGGVYLVLNERAGCLRAMKVLQSGRGEDGQIYSGCADPEAELRILRSLHHPMLPEMVDIVRREESYCLIMQFMEGETLDQVVRRRKVSTGEVLSWAAQLCGLLQYLHGRPIPVYYYDLKPSNIILDESGRLSLVDFGSARLLQGGREDSVLTGTPGFAAPERCRGRMGDERSDIYSLGAVLFYLLCGNKPHPDMSAQECRRQLRSAGREGTAANGAARLLADCLRTDPALRPQDAGCLQRRFRRTAGLWSLRIVRQYAASLIFYLIAGMSVLCLAAAPACYYASVGMRARVYERDIDRAPSAGEEERVRLLREAIGLYPDRGDAYLLLLDAMTDDGVFSAEESRLMTQILYGRGVARRKENQEYLQADKAAYFLLSYRMGLAYYYQAGDKSSAAAWFGRTLDTEIKEADLKEAEQIREKAGILLDMCEYDREQLLHAAGPEQEPRDLWNRMERLLRAGTEQADSKENFWILGEWLHMFYDNMDYLRRQAGAERVETAMHTLKTYLQEHGGGKADLMEFYEYVWEDWRVLCADLPEQEGD